jgi:hypothetical protein
MNTLHKRLFVMLFLVNAGTSPVLADNAIYIDQVGSGVDIDITQDGDGNKIGANDTDDTKMLIDGDNINLSIDAVGDTNKILGNIVGDDIILDMNVDGSTNTIKLNIDPTNTYGATNGDYVIDIDGGNNTIDLDVGTNDAAGSLDLDWAIDGDFNAADVEIDVGSGISAIDWTGDENHLDIDVDGYDGHEHTITGSGNYNSLTIEQQSTLQKDSITVDMSGSGTTTTDSTLCISQSDSGTATGCQ